MALTVSMTTHSATTTLATITGDAGEDDLIVTVAATLGDVATGRFLVVDLTGTRDLTAEHMTLLLDNTPANVIVVHPHHAPPIARDPRIQQSLRSADAAFELTRS